MNDPLAALHPLHPPAPVSWWPPAPGWWLLTALLLVLLGTGWWLHRRGALRRSALAELRILERTASDDTRVAAGVNNLLRRVALARFPRRQVAALSGEAWLQFLDSRARLSGFRDGPGRVLASAPYSARCRVERAALLALARRWIRAACRRPS